MIHLIANYPPSINNYYFRGRILKDKGRDYRNYFVSTFIPDKTIEGRVKLIFELYVPDLKGRDLDNLLKSTIDCLKHAKYFEDDKQVDYISITRKGLDRKNPRIEIFIDEILDNDPLYVNIYKK